MNDEKEEANMTVMKERIDVPEQCQRPVDAKRLLELLVCSCLQQQQGVPAMADDRMT